MGDRFRHELADGKRRLFAGHYHIKVAVRDSRAFWLSSGNWEPSNQPEVDPVGDGENELHAPEREEPRVARRGAQTSSWRTPSRSTFGTTSSPMKRCAHRCLKLRRHPSCRSFWYRRSRPLRKIPPGDARYFAPLFVFKRLKVQPLLTPDNYIDHVTAMVESADETIELQNQTLKWRDANVDPRFERLMNAMLDKHRDGVRVRFILRSDYSPEMKEMLVGHGFDSDQIRMQSRCHTKGMIVDSRRVLLGSHNLSEHGALVNRDASLIVDDQEVAQYFRQIFEFDWNRASRRVRETPPGISIYHPGQPVPEGYEVVPLPDMSL